MNYLMYFLSQQCCQFAPCTFCFCGGVRLPLIGTEHQDCVAWSCSSHMNTGLIKLSDMLIFLNTSVPAEGLVVVLHLMLQSLRSSAVATGGVVHPVKEARRMCWSGWDFILC